MSFFYKKHRCIQLLLFIFTFSLFAHEAFAESFGVPLNSTSKEDQWKLTADKVVTLDNGAIIEAHGDVVLERGTDVLKADFARYYTATDWIFMRDEVYVKMGRDELVADEAEFDLNTSTGFLKNGNVFMAGPHIYFTGEHVTKYFGDRYSFKNATITSCPPDDKIWELNAATATVEIDGYAVLTRANFALADVNAVPIPYMVLPAKNTRQTGLLKPDFGISTQHGLFYTQPWFWAIDESRDFTAYGSLYTNSGAMLGLEYRSHTDRNDKTWLGLDYLYSTEQGQDDRYWLRGMTDGDILDTGWKYKLNLDYVSDDDFLTDYQSMLTGYDNTKDSTYDFFGRDFAQMQANRVSEGYVYKDWDNFSLTAGFKYTQDPTYGDTLPLSSDPTVQTLPEVNAFLYPVKLQDFPVQLDASAQAGYYYRREGTSGMRTEFVPRLTLPLDLGITSLLAQAGFTNRGYFATTNSTSPISIEDSTSVTQNTNNTIFDAKLQTLIQLSRAYELNEKPSLIQENLGESSTTAFRHLFEPRLTYTYVENKNQENLPYYSQDDRILATNEIDLSLRNIFTTKVEKLTREDPADLNSPLAFTSTYNNIARFTLSSGYNFEEASRTKYVDYFPNKPFKDLTLDMEFKPFGLNLTSQVQYSMHGDGFTRFDIGTKVPLFALEKYVSWNTSFSHRSSMYDYQNAMQATDYDDIDLTTDLSLIKNTFTIKPTSAISFRIQHNFDLLESETYEFDINASYTHQCYIIGLNYSYTRTDQTYSINIILPGIFE